VGLREGTAQVEATQFVDQFRQNSLHFLLSLAEWMLVFVAVFGVATLLEKIFDRLEASVGTAGIYGTLFALAFIFSMFDGGFLRTHLAQIIGIGK